MAKGKSPYVRKGKKPYVYKFRSCSHNTTVRQSVPVEDRQGNTAMWRGKVCTVCNTVQEVHSVR
jgi:hypothetical protein